MLSTEVMPSSQRLSQFPKRQMTILALCRICEPIAFMSIFPYVYYMIQDFGVSKSQSEISIYAGMVTSAFTLAEFSSGVAWGRVSDLVGRKPVLLTGLAGTALSMLAFGFAPNLLIALLARALGGLLNGNIGVLQTTVAEMITNKEHQPRAYTIMPFVWCLGSIIGPILGGALARPAISYPSIFAANSIWARYPYLLPNLICTVIVAFGVAIGILFLEETHSVKKYRRDPGLEVGRWILMKCSSCRGRLFQGSNEKESHFSENLSLLDDEQLDNYSCTTTESQDAASLIGTSTSTKNGTTTTTTTTTTAKPAVMKAFTRQIIINIACYGILAYHTMTLDSMLPIFLSYPIPHDQSSWKMPFKFMIGYGLNTREIGIVLSIQGIYSMFATLCLFPLLVRRLGALGLFRIISLSYPVLYFLIPYFSLLPPSLNKLGVYVIAIWKCTFATMAFPSNAIMLTNAAPSLLSLGTINGVAASTASLSRAFGPTVSGVLISLGQSIGYSGLAWWFCAVISIIGGYLSLSMRETSPDEHVDEKVDPEQGHGS